MDSRRAVVLLATTFWLGAAAGQPPLSDEKRAAAQALLEGNGIDAEIAIEQFIDYRNGGGVVSGFQMHNGMKVFDAPLTFHFAPGGEPVRMPDGGIFAMTSAQDLSGLEFDEDALIDAGEAISVVRAPVASTAPEHVDADTLNSVRGCAEDVERLQFELGILDQRPTWQIRCRYSRSPGIFVDAQSSELVASPPQVVPGASPIPMPVPVPIPIPTPE